MKNRIGIVGGGQLARMLTFAAKQMGFVVTVLDPTPNSPGGQVADHQITAALNDTLAMNELEKRSDYITFDFEHADPILLEKMMKKGTPVNPSPKTLSLIKNKFIQKQFLQKAGLSVAPFVEIKTAEDIEKAGRKFGYPLVLKTQLGGYDGKGNAVIKTASNATATKKNIQKALEKLKGNSLYVEQYIPFEKELAIMVARSSKGEIKTFPVVETIHKNNILQIVLAPAQLDKKITKRAQNVAIQTMKQLKGSGIFGIEMFLTKKGEILINEIAPRVHNSGHYTIEACMTSQFEQHIRAITGLPLGETTMTIPTAVMVNILGKKNADAKMEGMAKALEIPGVSLHMYGKKDTRVERKMGHITAVGLTLNQALENAKKARKYISI